MALNLVNIGEARTHMLGELNLDIAEGRLYVGKNLNEHGAAVWADLLRDSIVGGTDETLALALLHNNCFKTHVERKTPSGGVTLAKVPVTAHTMLAEGEFNRFYVRGLCLHAITAGVPRLEIYRAKAVEKPRPESEAKLGQTVDPKEILEDLRLAQGVEPAFGLPPGPNSGLSLKI